MLKVFCAAIPPNTIAETAKKQAINIPVQYGCPVNSQEQGICSKVMMIMFPIMEAVRSGGDLENIGGDGKYTKDIVCPDGCVLFRMKAKKLGNENFFKGKFWG